jgi:glycosyltransferase involved in cell wall biosynthesis
MKSGKAPLISIGLPVFNGELYLAKAIDSILEQDTENFELLISDNCSTDSTPDICTRYARADSRIKCARLETNIGAAPNYNRVFELSSGTYFKWAAHDDIILPTFLRRCLETFELYQEKHSTPAIVYPHSDLIDENGGLIRPDTKTMHTTSRWPGKRVFDAVQAMGMAAPIFGLMPREMVARTRLIGSFLTSDYVFMLEAAMLGSIVQFDDVLFLRRVHPKQSRQANRKKTAVLAWFDPNVRQRTPENLNLHVEYFRSVSSLKGLSASERAGCYIGLTAGLLGLGARRGRVLQGRYRRRVAAFLKGAFLGVK